MNGSLHLLKYHSNNELMHIMSSSRQQGATSIVLGTHGLHGTACINAVLSGLEAGHRHIDTAQSYGNEEEVGNAIERSPIPRTEITVTTKISTPSRGNPKTFEEAYDSARASLDRMRLSYIDIFLIHAPGYEASARRVTWQALERLVEDGMIRSIGVSNYGIKYLLEMDNFTKIRPQIIQNEVRASCSEQRFYMQWVLAITCSQERVAPSMVSAAGACIFLCNTRDRNSGLLLPPSKSQGNSQRSLQPRKQIRQNYATNSHPLQSSKRMGTCSKII